jgi:4-amino-4-deoxy-L-arabinose transferase-like glycosyltransferase
MEWIEGGVYNYEDQHPPLARVTAAFGLRLAGSHWARDPDMSREGQHLLGYGNRYWRNLFFARLAMLPFFWLEAVVVFLWARRIAGSGAALFGTLIFTTTPPILGHAGLATTDTALCAFTGAAALCSLYWAEKPNWLRSIALGVTAALAILSKFSALPFLAVVWLAMFSWHLWLQRPGWRKAVRQVAAGIPGWMLSAGVAALLIWSAYRFTIGPVWYLQPWLGNRIPAPAFFRGLWSVWEHNREGHLAYLLGRLSWNGFWYYYPVVTVVKTPVATLLLFTLAFLMPFRNRAVPFAIGTPVAFMAGVLGVAMFTHINIGVRHILPVYTGFAICAGVAAWTMWNRGLASRAALAGLLIWQIISIAAIHPDYIAYTNELAGRHPERILADSDLDWGQGMKALALRLDQLGVKEISFLMNGTAYLGGNPFPLIRPVPDGDTPPHGWCAISITPWKLHGQPRWVGRIEPQERIGHAILLYWFP